MSVGGRRISIYLHCCAAIQWCDDCANRCETVTVHEGRGTDEKRSTQDRFMKKDGEQWSEWEPVLRNGDWGSLLRWAVFEPMSVGRWMGDSSVSSMVVNEEDDQKQSLFMKQSRIGDLWAMLVLRVQLWWIVGLACVSFRMGRAGRRAELSMILRNDRYLWKLGVMSDH